MNKFFMQLLRKPAALCWTRWALASAAMVFAPVWAGGMQSLELFLKNTQSGRADFVQVVTSPAKEGQTARVKTSSGNFAFARPGRFKFEYLKPFAQTMVADGQTLWMYDVDLNQVTARQQAQVLGATPAALIASAPNLKALHAEFFLADAPARSGLEWVQASPRAKDGQLQWVRVGLRSGTKGMELAVLEMLDSFGQTSVLTFSPMELNPALPASTFEFKPPKGADVIRQ